MAEPHDLSAQVAAYLTAAEADGRRLLEAAQSGWAKPAPHCPGWDNAELVRHMGSILEWMAAVVSSGERVTRRTLPPPPKDVGDLPSWYLAALLRTLLVLGAIDPAAEGWTFSSTGDRRAWWWCRRLAVEVAVHRWDAQRALGGTIPAAVESDVAAAGVEEFVLEFLPGLRTSAALRGSLHLHASVGRTEWWIDFDAAAPALPIHREADTCVEGTPSDILLWLNNREPLESLEVLGHPEIIEQWNQLQF